MAKQSIMGIIFRRHAMQIVAKVKDKHNNKTVSRFSYVNSS